MLHFLKLIWTLSRHFFLEFCQILSFQIFNLAFSISFALSYFLSPISGRDTRRSSTYEATWAVTYTHTITIALVQLGICINAGILYLCPKSRVIGRLRMREAAKDRSGKSNWSKTETTSVSRRISHRCFFVKFMVSQDRIANIKFSTHIVYYWLTIQIARICNIYNSAASTISILESNVPFLGAYFLEDN